MAQYKGQQEITASAVPAPAPALPPQEHYRQTALSQSAVYREQSRRHRRGHTVL